MFLKTLASLGVLEETREAPIPWYFKTVLLICSKGSTQMCRNAAVKLRRPPLKIPLKTQNKSQLLPDIEVLWRTRASRLLTPDRADPILASLFSHKSNQPSVKSKPIAIPPTVPTMGNSSSSRAKAASKSTEAAAGGKVNHKKFVGARGRKSSPTTPTPKKDRVVVIPTADPLSSPSTDEEAVLVPRLGDDDVSYDTASDDEYDSDEESVDEGESYSDIYLSSRRLCFLTPLFFGENWKVPMKGKCQ